MPYDIIVQMPESNWHRPRPKVDFALSNIEVKSFSVMKLRKSTFSR